MRIYSFIATVVHANKMLQNPLALHLFSYLYSCCAAPDPPTVGNVAVYVGKALTQSVTGGNGTHPDQQQQEHAMERTATFGGMTLEDHFGGMERRDREQKMLSPKQKQERALLKNLDPRTSMKVSKMN